MLESEFHIPLLGREEVRAPSFFERLGTWVGSTPDLRTGSMILQDPVQVASSVFLALYTTGLVDALSVSVDNRVVFVDRRGEGGHLARAHALAVRAVQAAGPDFRSLEVAVETEYEGMQVLAHIEILGAWPTGTDPLRVRMAAKVRELFPSLGESARAYDRRIRGFAASYALIEGYRTQLQGLAEHLAESLAQALNDAPLRFEGTWIRVVQVQPAQIGGFRDLLFGGEVLRPRYRAMPRLMRRGVFSDPFVYFYFDPYYDFLNWVVLDAMLYEGAWRSRDVRVLEPAGTLLFRGNEADAGAHSTGTLDAVGFTRTGHLRVNPVVPRPKQSGDPLAGDEDWEPPGSDWSYANTH